MRFFQSFVYAWRGLRYIFLHEFNFRVQLMVSFFTLLLTFFLKVRVEEIIIILLLIALVLLLEILNSALEKLSDILKPRLSEQVEVVKNMLAAMVLLASLLALGIGLTIFTPYIIELFIKKW